MHSDFSLLDGPAMGNPSLTVPQSTPPVGAVSSSKGADSSGLSTCVGVGESRLSDSAREEAISRAAALVEYLHALSQLHWALWSRDGCFDHRAAYDLALSDCHAARGILERLQKLQGAKT